MRVLLLVVFAVVLGGCSSTPNTASSTGCKMETISTQRYLMSDGSIVEKDIEVLECYPRVVKRLD